MLFPTGTFTETAHLYDGFTHSTKGNPNGHVLVIESVDAASNKIVVAEGNYTTNKAIQGTINTPVVRQTYTFEQWNARVFYRDPVYVGFPN